MPLITFLGPPGSGKGTASQRLRDDLCLPYLATGDLIRETSRDDGEIGERLRRLIADNAFVPDDLIIEMVMGRIGVPGNGTSAIDVILDGFPRTVAQARFFDDALARHGQALTHALLIDCPDAVIRERIAGRRACGDCARPYHVTFIPPPTPGRCACGGRLQQRSDDHEDKVDRRLADYREKTIPLVEHYRSEGILVVIDGNALAEEVYACVRAAIR